MPDGPAPKQLRQDGAISSQKLVWNGSNYVPALKDNLSGSGAPTVNNDSSEDYEIGSIWVDTTASPRTYYACVDASVGVAVWKELTAGENLTVFTVPTTVSVRDMLYITGALTADRADNSAAATGPVAGVVITKPTSTTAEVQFSGIISGYAGLTAGAVQFLGTTGGIIETSLPTTPGNVIQKIGIAVDTTTLLFDPDLRVVL